MTTPTPTSTPTATGTGTGTPSPSPTPSGTGQVQALQTGLAAEHAVIWGYGVVGAHAGDRSGPLRHSTVRSTSSPGL